MEQNAIKRQKLDRVLELVVVIFLGVASVFSAFSAWQSALQGSAMSKDYNEGIALITDANELYVESGQVISNDMAIYMELIALQYDWSYAPDGSEEKSKAEEIYSVFYNKFVTEELAGAIEWSEGEEEATGVYTSPFENKDYIAAIYASADEQYQQGRELLDEGHMYNTNGDKMGLIVIYFATVMFLLGICGTLKNTKLRLGLVAFSAAIFIFAVVQMCMIPFLTA